MYFTCLCDINGGLADPRVNFITLCGIICADWLWLRPYNVLPDEGGMTAGLGRDKGGKFNLNLVV